jgi:hypothetical protein
MISRVRLCACIRYYYIKDSSHNLFVYEHLIKLHFSSCSNKLHAGLSMSPNAGCVPQLALCMDSRQLAAYVDKHLRVLPQGDMHAVATWRLLQVC